MFGVTQFSLEIDEIEPAARELAKCRADPRQPIILKVCQDMAIFQVIVVQ